VTAPGAGMPATLIFPVAIYFVLGVFVAVAIGLWIRRRFRSSAVVSFALLGAAIWPLTLLWFAVSALATSRDTSMTATLTRGDALRQGDRLRDRHRSTTQAPIARAAPLPGRRRENPNHTVRTRWHRPGSTATPASA